MQTLFLCRKGFPFAGIGVIRGRFRFDRAKSGPWKGCSQRVNRVCWASDGL